MSEKTDTPITDEFERATCDGLESALQHARDLERQLECQRNELARVVRKLTYENCGRYFIGIHGDEEVTDLVAPVLATLNRKEES